MMDKNMDRNMMNLELSQQLQLQLQLQLQQFQQLGQSAQSELKLSLLQFQDSLHTDPRVEKLIQGWERDILIESLETASGKEEFYLLQVRKEGVSLLEGKGGGEEKSTQIQTQSQHHRIHLRATEETFVSIFNGELAPAECYFDGNLQCFASEEDQTKLDAITMVLWGI